MTRLMRLALRLYPRAWRRRYGDELAALVEDSQQGWRGVIDVASGGLTMQLRSAPVVLTLAALLGTATGGLLYLASPLRYSASSSVQFAGTDFRGMLGDLMLPRHVASSTVVGPRLMAYDVEDSALTVTTFGAQADAARAAHEQVLGEFAEVAKGRADGIRPFSIRITDSRDSVQKSRGVETIPFGAALGLLLGGTGLVARRVAHARSVRT